MEQHLLNIANMFAIKGEVKDITPFGGGIINSTYRVTTEGDGPDYVLQNINNAVFKDVDLLQRNIVAVTSHIRGKLRQKGVTDADRRVLTPVPLKGSDLTYCCVDGKYWRVTELIPDSYTKEAVTPESSYDAGKAFGEFEAMLADIPVELGETIPDFHNMELRSRQLKEAVAADAAGRMASGEVREIVDYLASFDERMCAAEKMHRDGILPKRICHCDTKVNNMLFDAEGKVLCVIDLDTVMPSFVFSDFGDFIRTAGNATWENDPDITKVGLRMDIFKAFAKGYVESASAFLTPVEKDNLPYGALLFPYMQAVRFLTDYINGDTYYKIEYPEQNLVRTRNQVALFKSILEHYDSLVEYIASL